MNDDPETEAPDDSEFGEDEDPVLCRHNINRMEDICLVCDKED